MCLPRGLQGNHMPGELSSATSIVTGSSPGAHTGGAPAPGACRRPQTQGHRTRLRKGRPEGREALRKVLASGKMESAKASDYEKPGE